MVAGRVWRTEDLRPGRSGACASIVILIVALAVAGSASTIGNSNAVRGQLPYGPGIAADGLANTQVGGTSCGCPSLTSSYRFRASQSAALTGVRLYIIDGKLGYSGGTGVRLTISLNPDDGSADHRRLATTLASMT